MTLEEIEALPKEMLIPADVAAYLGCSPYAINVLTRNGENPFPFPVIRIGNRVKIPKIAFVRAMRGELHNRETEKNVLAEILLSKMHE